VQADTLRGRRPQLPKRYTRPARFARTYASDVRIFTIGHGNRPFEDLVATLASACVTRLGDVRAFPASRRNPQFAREALETALPPLEITYRWLPKLGGRRRKGPEPSPNPSWTVQAFRNYADYMDTAEFQEGLDELLALAGEAPAAFMCAETHPSQCHRRLVADKLASLGHEVVHLITPSRSESHRPPPFLRLDGDRLRYDRPVNKEGQIRLE
jgi:uncharacterized protein (DUF488 family)